MTPPIIATTRKIKRIAPLQLGKMLAVIYGLIALLLIPFFALAAITASQAPAAQRGLVMISGVGFMIALPFLYAALGFIFGAIGALIYNVVAKWIGGIEVEVE